MHLLFYRCIRCRVCKVCCFKVRATVTATTTEKIETPFPDYFYNKKKFKDNEDLKVFKDMANSVRIMTATLITSTSKVDMNKNSCSELAETLNPEIEAFLQVLKSSLGRILPTFRLTCLI